MSLLQMSFSGAVLILAITVIRALTIHRLPKRTFLVLWKIVILRLLLPVCIPSIFSIYTLTGLSAPSGQKAPPYFMDSVNLAGLPDSSDSPSVSLYALPQAAASPSAEPQGNSTVWFAIWCVGTAVCALYFLVSYRAFRRDFLTSLPVCNDYAENWLKKQKLKRRIAIRQSDQITSPLTYGILKPVILMPKSTDWKDTETLQYILTHECAHIRHLDAVTKLTFIFVLCIHWFNPMVWVMYLLFNRDIELARDENVICQFGEVFKASYALTLIHMEEQKKCPALFTNNFSKNSVEERIRAIMKYKKISKLTVIAAFVMVTGITAAFATSPAKAENKNEDPSGTVVGTETPAEALSDTENASGKSKLDQKIENTFEVRLAPGEEIALETIHTMRGQVIVVTEMCEGVQLVGIRLDGDDHTSSSESRVEKIGCFTSDCIQNEEDRTLTVYNPGSSDIDVTIGYGILEEEEYNSLGTWDLLNYLKQEYQNR